MRNRKKVLPPKVKSLPSKDMLKVWISQHGRFPTYNGADVDRMTFLMGKFARSKE